MTRAAHAARVDIRTCRVCTVVAKRRAPVPPLLVIAALLGALLAGAAAPAPVDAASLTVRLEAGPHTGVVFDGAWRVVSRRTVSLADPVTVTASARSSRPSSGTYLRLTSGALAGTWVHESTVAYVPGIVDVSAFSPPRSTTLEAGRVGALPVRCRRCHGGRQGPERDGAHDQ